jgi:regulator of sigma E protease
VSPVQYLYVILLLGLLIFVHELGHFLAAKAWGLPVERFSLGLGPVLWSRRLGATRYCLSAIPFGGYVLLGVADEAAYLALPLGRRVFFSLAGPAANVFLAFGCYGVLYFMTAGEHTLVGAVTQPARWTTSTLLAIATAIPELFRHSENVSSFVGIVAEGGRFVGVNLARFFMLGAHLSLSLAVFNLLPLPPLDGGKIVFDALCRVSRRLSRAYLPSAVCGWVALASLMLYATVQDVWKYLL